MVRLLELAGADQVADENLGAEAERDAEEHHEPLDLQGVGLDGETLAAEARDEGGDEHEREPVREVFAGAGQADAQDAPEALTGKLDDVVGAQAQVCAVSE